MSTASALADGAAAQRGSRSPAERVAWAAMANGADGADGAEQRRLDEDREGIVRWKEWGPFVADRAWGTVREDYSEDGDAWRHFPHDHARSRAYRWNEDGLAGVCDRRQRLCLAVALWNEADPILKERLFGLTNAEGNHGEDVKEVYFHEDATPTFSYLRMLYRYPQRAFPYEELLDAHRGRPKDQPEVELWDVGAFDGERFFDVTVEYAKAGPDDLVMVVTAVNRGPQAAPLHVLPHLWFRNTWSWTEPEGPRPELRAVDAPRGVAAARATHPTLGERFLYVQGDVELLFTENETNAEALFGSPNSSPYVKDAFHRRVVRGDERAVNPARTGTKAAAWWKGVVPAGGSARVVVRLSPTALAAPFDGVEALVTLRQREADAFYRGVGEPGVSEERRAIVRQSAAGLFWTLQYYHYDVDTWLRGDKVAPPARRLRGRNWDFRHLAVEDVISMPDKWEYPWFAAWDLAFHAVAIAEIDPEQAKHQLKLMVKDWYQHPSGQIPAYEWEFGDLNPPVHAWATYEVFKIDRRKRGVADRSFLERVFHKLLVNFGWWVNRRDSSGNNVFEGGFLGLDNVSFFDRSEPTPPGILLEQADATAWMAMYCLDMMRIALELAAENSAYEDLASKFLEHFLRIAYALNHDQDGVLAPWDEEEGFYFDLLREHGRCRRLPVRSMVGLVPLFATATIPADVYERLAHFRRRTEWFLDRHERFRQFVTIRDGRRVLTAVPPGRLERVLAHLFDEDEFLSPFGPRSLSKEHGARPVALWLEPYGRPFAICYEPGESTSRMKGGNSNWRGPVWLPMGYLLHRALLRLDHGFGDAVAVPGVSGRPARRLRDGAWDLARRMVSLFEPDERGHLPVYGETALFRDDPHLAGKLLFYEHFHGETGEGLGASHQTGWTALAGSLVLRLARARREG